MYTSARDQFDIKLLTYLQPDLLDWQPCLWN